MPDSIAFKYDLNGQANSADDHVSYARSNPLTAAIYLGFTG